MKAIQRHHRQHLPVVGNVQKNRDVDRSEYQQAEAANQRPFKGKRHVSRNQNNKSVMRVRFQY